MSASANDTERTTPLADMATVDRLPATVVEPGDSPRLHGYDIQQDLARHYSHSEAVLLALTGELPDSDAAAAFDVAMIFLMETPISAAPAHAARVTAVGKGGPGAVSSVGAIGLVAQARHELSGFDQLVAAVEAGNLPANARARTDAERESVARLRAALPWRELGILAHDIGLMPAILVVLIECGINRSEAALTALVHGRLVTTLAEGFGAGDGFSSLPVRAPEMVYIADSGEVS